MEGSLQRRFNQVLFGHGKQLWGLAAHPEEELFATAGHDKNIALWRRHKLVWVTQVQTIFTHLKSFVPNNHGKLQVSYECISAAFHPFGAAIAVGSTEGHLIIINCENGATMLTIRVCGSPLNCIEFNQGNTKLFFLFSTPHLISSFNSW